MGNLVRGCVWQKRGEGTLCRHVPWRRPHAGKLFCLLLPFYLWSCSSLFFLPRFFIRYGYWQSLFLTISSLFQIYCLYRKCTFSPTKLNPISSIPSKYNTSYPSFYYHHHSQPNIIIIIIRLFANKLCPDQTQPNVFSLL